MVMMTGGYYECELQRRTRDSAFIVEMMGIHCCVLTSL